MKFTVTGRKATIKDQFKDRVEKKLRKLDRFFDDDVSAAVTVTREGERETVEITIHSGGLVFRAEKTTDDRMDSLEAVVDLLFKQIVKNKSKLEKKLKNAAFDFSMEEAPEKQDEPAFKVVRNKKFSVRPMDEEEAILQMNLIGHEFFMFRNANSEEINVIYRRKDGSYGLIEPDVDED